VFALSDIKAHADSGAWDLIVVDCAPTAETIRLLSLPDVIARYMERVFPAQRALTRAARPVLKRLTELPIAADTVFAATQRFYDRLEGVRDLLTDGAVTSARIVVNPERVVVAEARRTFTYLSLFGYHVDAVIANRLLPDAVADPWFDDWKRVQKEQMAVIEESFGAVPVLPAPLMSEEPVGVGRLAELAENVYGSGAGDERLHADEPLRLHHRGAAMVLDLALPCAVRDEVDLARMNGELLVTVGPYRRSVALPDSLHRREVSGAKLVGGRLEVEFSEVRS
ncbi:MAG: ArsA family ATPase, partial [Actinobacteria bacterium]|nr:ArsA family ATPase [Actinomycetota bacterium]